MRRRTARALSVAFAAGAVLAVAGPAAAADIDPGAPPAAQTATTEGVPGPCAAPQQCALPGAPAAVPGDPAAVPGGLAAVPDGAAAPSYDPAFPGRGEGAPSLQGVTPTREGWAPGAAPSGGFGLAQPPQPPQAVQPSQVAPSSPSFPGLAAGRDPYLPSPQGIAPGHDGVAPTRDGLSPGHDGLSLGHDGVGPGHDGVGPGHDGVGPGHDGVGPGHDGVGPGHDGVGPGHGDGRGCTGPRPCPDAEPPTVQYGVEAGTGGSFTDSVPALAAGATLIAAACGGAGYRLYGRWRASVGRSADV